MAISPTQNHDFHQDEVQMALRSNESGRTNATTGSGGVIPSTSASGSVKTDPKYVSADNFMDNILR
jgi:hypothetical protein